MTQLLQSIDERTKLAGSNNFEILCFKINEKETYGINVFKVREVIQLPEITSTAMSPRGIKGIVSVRGDIIPVLDLNEWFNLPSYEDSKLLIVTEFSGSTQAFLASSVTRIYRVEWESVHPVDKVLSSQTGSNALTAIVRLEDGTLISILDVESIVTGVSGINFEEQKFNIQKKLTGKLLYAEDSSVARKQMTNLFNQLGIEYHTANNGEEAWKYIESILKTARDEKRPVSDYLNLIVTDIEMPIMDGYVLTQRVRNTPEISDVPILMYSSLTSTANQKRGLDLGANGYINKFEADSVSAALSKYLA